MTVRLRVPAALRELCDGQAVQIVELEEGATVADLLDAVAATHPALGRRIRDEQAALRPHVNIFVGQDNIRGLEGPATVLHPGVEVSILPAISGG